MAYLYFYCKPQYLHENLRHSLNMNNIFSAKNSTPVADVPHHHPTARYYSLATLGMPALPLSIRDIISECIDHPRGRLLPQIAKAQELSSRICFESPQWMDQNSQEMISKEETYSPKQQRDSITVAGMIPRSPWGTTESSNAFPTAHWRSIPVVDGWRSLSVP